MSLRQHCTQDHGGRLRLSCLRLEHLFTRAEKGDKARKMCATDIGNSILLKVYTRHHLLNIKAHRILYSFYRRTSQAQTWWAPRINNFNQLEKKKKGTALLMTIFSISRNHYLKNKLDGKKMFIRPKLISKKPQLTFPFSAEMFRDFQAPHVLPAVPRKLFLFVFSDWCYCTHWIQNKTQTK